MTHKKPKRRFATCPHTGGDKACPKCLDDAHTEICRLLGEMTFGTLIRHDKLWQRILKIPLGTPPPQPQEPEPGSPPTP